MIAGQKPTRTLSESKNELKPFIEILCKPDIDTAYEECEIINFKAKLEEDHKIIEIKLEFSSEVTVS